MSPTDAQELGGAVIVEVAAIECLQRLVEELYGKAFGKLVFCKPPLSLGDAHRDRLFVGPRYAPKLKLRDAERSALTGGKRGR